MELTLNLGWTVLAIAMCWLWARHPRREGRGREAQFVSLVLVLVTMFTVITMYDDMAMAQKPAETRCFQREDDLGAHAHSPFHPVVASTPALVVVPPLNRFRSIVPNSLPGWTVKNPFISAIQNRPPPTA